MMSLTNLQRRRFMTSPAPMTVDRISPDDFNASGLDEHLPYSLSSLSRSLRFKIGFHSLPPIPQRIPNRQINGNPAFI